MRVSGAALMMRAGSFDAVHLRHTDVHKDNIWARRGGPRDDGRPIAALLDHLDVVLGG